MKNEYELTCPNCSEQTGYFKKEGVSWYVDGFRSETVRIHAEHTVEITLPKLVKDLGPKCSKCDYEIQPEDVE